jgi:hypothetical protein
MVWSHGKVRANNGSGSLLSENTYITNVGIHFITSFTQSESATSVFIDRTVLAFT